MSGDTDTLEDIPVKHVLCEPPFKGTQPCSNSVYTKDSQEASRYNRRSSESPSVMLATSFSRSEAMLSS
ncbi:hypothetical protein E2320_014527 [Naja naja]|nr:hypothetical protein E2320_014527 [Naja naja]